MGGFGSTRWDGIAKKQQADSSLMLRAPRTRRAPAVLESASGFYRWPRYGYSVRYELWKGEGRAVMTLRFVSGGAYCVQHVGLEATPANLGGVRWWWRCPECDRRCAKLYSPPRRDLFKCRTCYDLSYESAQASRCTYYELYKRCAWKGHWTASEMREEIRASMNGAYLVRDLYGIPDPSFD